jgi:hypothetical protein
MEKADATTSLTRRCSQRPTRCVTFLYVLSSCYEASPSAAWLSLISLDGIAHNT